MRNRSAAGGLFRSARLLSVLFLATFLLPARPAGAVPPPTGLEVGSEWSAPGLGNLFAVGEIAPDAGLECIAFDQLGDMKLYRLPDGSSLGPLPTPFDVPSTQYFLRDIDSDGLAEIICLDPAVAPGEPVLIGCLQYDAGIQEVWPAVATPLGSAEGIDFMNLAGTEPVAIAVYGGAGFFVYSSLTGALLYDSTTTLGAGWSPVSVVIDDFDDDGYEEALVDFEGSTGPPFPHQTDLIGAINPATAAPASSFGAASLFQNRPNPMANSTRIEYDLPTAGRVRLRVFDVRGRRVRTLVDGPVQAGRHAAQWNGRDDDGAAVASGVYFYELDVEGQRSTRRLVRVR